MVNILDDEFSLYKKDFPQNNFNAMEVLCLSLLSNGHELR